MSNFVLKNVHFRFVVSKRSPTPNFFSSGENEELGPPPSVDEAADALMTRLGFLLGDKIVSGEPGSSYHAPDDGEVVSSSQDVFSFKCKALAFGNICIIYILYINSLF